MVEGIERPDGKGNLRVELLTGSVKGKARQQLLNDVKAGEVRAVGSFGLCLQDEHAAHGILRMSEIAREAGGGRHAAVIEPPCPRVPSRGYTNHNPRYGFAWSLHAAYSCYSFFLPIIFCVDGSRNLRGRGSKTLSCYPCYQGCRRYRFVRGHQRGRTAIRRYFFGGMRFFMFRRCPLRRSPRY